MLLGSIEAKRFEKSENMYFHLQRKKGLSLLP